MQRRYHGEGEHAPDQQGDGSADVATQYQGHRQHDQRQHGEEDFRRAIQRPVGQAATQAVAKGEANADQYQRQGYEAVRGTGQFGQHRRHVGVQGEHGAGTEHGGGHCQQHAGAGNDRQFLAHVRHAAAFTLGQGVPQRGHGQQAQHGGTGKGHAPADLLADPGGGRHAADVGDGQAHEHGGHGTGLFLLGHHAGGHYRAKAEERAVVEAGDQARGEQGVVVR
ncbi:hypothetical protein D3C75_760500 [compost metagenome]